MAKHTEQLTTLFFALRRWSDGSRFGMPVYATETGLNGCLGTLTRWAHSLSNYACSVVPRFLLHGSKLSRELLLLPCTPGCAANALMFCGQCLSLNIGYDGAVSIILIHLHCMFPYNTLNACRPPSHCALILHLGNISSYITSRP